MERYLESQETMHEILHTGSRAGTRQSQNRMRRAQGGRKDSSYWPKVSKRVIVVPGKMRKEGPAFEVI